MHLQHLIIPFPPLSCLYRKALAIPKLSLTQLLSHSFSSRKTQRSSSFFSSAMASPSRNNNRTGNNQPGRVDPQQPVLNVAPLNSMPYIGPPSPHVNVSPTPSPTEQGTGAAQKVGPAMIFLPSNSTREEVDNIVDRTKTGVALTGSAALGVVGPAIGAYDIAENDDSYLFRVSLPGVARDEKDFCCDIEPDGKIKIKGVTTTGEKTVCKYSQVFKMQTQNLCPPGHFCIEFQLPGPVNSQIFTGHLQDGVLEGVVKKR